MDRIEGTWGRYHDPHPGPEHVEADLEPHSEKHAHGQGAVLEEAPGHGAFFPRGADERFFEAGRQDRQEAEYA